MTSTSSPRKSWRLLQQQRPTSCSRQRALIGWTAKEHVVKLKNKPRQSTINVMALTMAMATAMTMVMPKPKTRTSVFVNHFIVFSHYLYFILLLHSSGSKIHQTLCFLQRCFLGRLKKEYSKRVCNALTCEPFSFEQTWLYFPNKCISISRFNLCRMNAIITYPDQKWGHPDFP